MSMGVPNIGDDIVFSNWRDGERVDPPVVVGWWVSLTTLVVVIVLLLVSTVMIS